MFETLSGPTLIKVKFSYYQMCFYFFVYTENANYYNGKKIDLELWMNMGYFTTKIAV